MATCNSCGGVLGRDCFNPQECAEISFSVEQNLRHQAETEGEHLKRRVEDLENRLQAVEMLLQQQKNPPGAVLAHREPTPLGDYR